MRALLLAALLALLGAVALPFFLVVYLLGLVGVMSLSIFEWGPYVFWRFAAFGALLLLPFIGCASTMEKAFDRCERHFRVDPSPMCAKVTGPDEVGLCCERGER